MNLDLRGQSTMVCHYGYQQHPVFLGGMIGKRGPLARSRLSGVTFLSLYDRTGVSESTQRRVMWVQVVLASKANLVRREFGMVKRYSAPLEMLRNAGDVCFWCEDQE